MNEIELKNLILRKADIFSQWNIGLTDDPERDIEKRDILLRPIFFD